MWCALRVLAAAMLCCASCQLDDGDGGPSTTHAAGIFYRAPCVASRTSATCVDMYIVAHDDDDLLFMNPDISRSIAAGNRVIVVYVTAGQHGPPPACSAWTGCQAAEQWTNRERGALSAYAQMADPADPWLSSVGNIQALGGTADVPFARYDRPTGHGANLPLTLIFLRIPDFTLEAMWAHTGTTQQLSCECRAQPSGPTTCPLRGETSFDGHYPTIDGAAVLEALRTLMSALAADSVSTLDSSGLYTSANARPQAYADNPSHVAVSLYAIQALAIYQSSLVRAGSTRSVQLRTYRGYSVPQEPEDLSVTQKDAKLDVFEYYRHWDCVTTYCDRTGAPSLCGHEWTGRSDRSCDAQPQTGHSPCSLFERNLHRVYESRTLVGLTPLTGRISTGSACLATAGTAIVTASCASAPSWTITPQHQLQLAGTSSCIESTDAGLTLADCSDPTAAPGASTFFVMTNGQIRASASATPIRQTFTETPAMCLAAGGSVGSAVTTELCDKACVVASTQELVSCTAGRTACPTGTCAAGQTCEVTPSGDACFAQAWSVGSCNPGTETCVDCPCTDTQVETGTCDEVHGTPGICLPLASGYPAPGQDWTMIFDPARLVSPQYDDTTEIRTSPAYYRTFGIVGHNVCVRRDAGLYCSPFAGTTLTAAFRLAAASTDGPGWNQDDSGAAAGAALDTSSRDECLVGCDRGYDGVTCTDGSTSSFSTLDGWDMAPYYYGSIRYADVNGDGKPDICGRGYYGIACALKGTSYGLAQTWSSDFSRAEGWDVDGAGDTLQYADVDGDGLADVCGRSANGVFCASGTGSSFRDYHVWSFDSVRGGGGGGGDFGDRDPTPLGTIHWSSSAAYYGSLKLGDLNHDGLADVCGRGPAGVYCAFSVGNGFDAKRLVLPFDFTDELGWSAPDKGATVGVGDLTGDGRLEVCGRGHDGVVCASGY